MGPRQEFASYLARLREIPFVRATRIRGLEATRGKTRPDGLLVVKTPEGEHELSVELKRTFLTYTTVAGVLAQMAAIDAEPWILFAPYVPRPLGQYLAKHGVNYVDLEGNCRLVLGKRYVAHVEGRTQQRSAGEHRGLRVPGYQVLFTILAEPKFLNATVRQLAEAAGTSKTAAAETLRRLQAEGLLGEAKAGRFLLETKGLLDRWLAGYSTNVRPRLLIGTYRTAEPDPKALERRLESVLGDKPRWAYGGGAAAIRLLRHYRGERTVVHLQAAAPDLRKQLGAFRADDGPLVLIRAPGEVAFKGVKTRTVHPLLIYTELLAAGDPRSREAAVEIRERFLEHLH